MVSLPQVTNRQRHWELSGYKQNRGDENEVLHQLEAKKSNAVYHWVAINGSAAIKWIWTRSIAMSSSFTCGFAIGNEIPSGHRNAVDMQMPPLSEWRRLQWKREYPHTNEYNRYCSRQSIKQSIFSETARQAKKDRVKWASRIQDDWQYWNQLYCYFGSGLGLFTHWIRVSGKPPNGNIVFLFKQRNHHQSIIYTVCCQQQRFPRINLQHVQNVWHR